MPEDDFDYDVDNSILEFDENNQTDSSVQGPSSSVRYILGSRKELESLKQKAINNRIFLKATNGMQSSFSVLPKLDYILLK